LGQSKKRTVRLAAEFATLQSEFEALGVNTELVGFYDDLAFLKAEQTNTRLLEKYARWVALRPRSPDYEARARTTVPRLASIIERRIEKDGLRGSCLNVSAMISRMLDRLGIWNFVHRGAFTVSIVGRNDVATAYSRNISNRKRDVKILTLWGNGY
jgi:hypothetical protein